MKIKIKKELLVCIIIATVPLCFWGAKKIYNYYLYKMTIAEVQKLNENSNFFGYKLLGNPPEDAIGGIPQTLKDNSSEDIFYADEYHGGWVIVSMKLVSNDAKLLGISPGDSKQIIADKLDGTPFKKINDPFEDTIRYRAYHITLDFEFKDNGNIADIYIYIDDPSEKHVDY